MILSEDVGDLQGSGIKRSRLEALEQGLPKVPFLGMFEVHHFEKNDVFVMFKAYKGIIQQTKHPI